MSIEPEPVEGVVDVPDHEAAAARMELERVEREGLMPAPTEHARTVSYMEAIQLGHVLARSGYFKDAQGAAQAAVKVMVGAELGFAPMAAIMGVHIVEGRPMLAGRLLGAVVKRSGTYDFSTEWTVPLELEDNGMPKAGTCVVTMWHRDGHGPGAPEKGVSPGYVALEPTSEFTIGEAAIAGLVKANSNWHKYPRKMLFWRALSWGVDFHCPHLIGGMPLVAEEDRDEADAGPSMADALDPPAERPPALATDEAEKLRERAKAAYDRVRSLNAAQFPPAKFSNQMARAEHSITALEGLCESLESLAETEEAIVAATSRLLELDPDGAPTIIDGARGNTRAEVREALEKAVNALGGEQVEGDEKGEGDGDE